MGFPFCLLTRFKAQHALERLETDVRRGRFVASQNLYNLALFAGHFADALS
jgi:hypothetical protein